MLTLAAVARTYSAQPPVRALRSASFVVERGELVAIVGRSGSGKSTLLNVLALLDRPTAGRYEIEGRPVDELSDRDQTSLRARYFGFVFQQAFVLMNRTAQENVETALVPLGYGRAERRLRASDMLDRVGLYHRRHFFPTTLSGGECQRVAIARALATEPRVLVCDEPTGNLDEQTSDEVIGLLRVANESGVAVVVATHDLSIARSFPRVLSVRDGRVSEGMGNFVASSGGDPELTWAKS
jgi:putative ABC transport system ATP-binding protein